MRLHAVRLALALLVVCTAFAVWAHEHTTSRARSPSNPPAGGDLVAPKAGPRVAVDRPRAVGEYSFDERPCSVVGRVDWGSGSGVEGARVLAEWPVVELRRGNGRGVVVPVTVTGFFGVGGLEEGEWSLACRLRGYWEEERGLRLELGSQRSEERIVLERHPRLVLTLSHPVEGATRARRLLEREAWLHDAWIVGTLGEPGERIVAEPRSRERLASWMPGVRDEVAGARRTLLFDGPIDQRLAEDGWIAFVVGDRVVGAKRVARGEREVAFEFDETQLARALGGLALRVLDDERGTPLRDARVELWPSSVTVDRRFALGWLDLKRVEDGFQLPRLVCRTLVAVVEAPGRERRAVGIEVRPGETTRVEVRLAKETVASGIVVDAGGRGIECELELVPFDEDDRAVRALGTRTGSSAVDGRFRFADLSHALWLVRSRGGPLVFAPQLVDTRGGNASDVRLEARLGVPVRFLTRIGAMGDASERLELRDERGFVVVERDGWMARQSSGPPLLPGRYALRFAPAHGSVLVRDFVVGSEPVELQLDLE